MKGGTINKNVLLIGVGSGIIAGTLAALIFATNSSLIICALFAGLIAFVVIMWFELNRIQREKDDLEGKIKDFGRATMQDMETLTEAVEDQFVKMGEEIDANLHELGVLIMTAKFGPEEEDED